LILQAVEASEDSVRLSDSKLPRQDSNLDKENQKVSGVRRQTESSTTCGNNANLFDARLRESANFESLDADLRRLLDAWPTLPTVIRAGILAMINAAGSFPAEPPKHH
jgi:hypothetical protein